MSDTDVDTHGFYGAAAKVDQITIADMDQRGKLFKIDKLREVLSSTEPLEQLTFPVGDQIRFRLMPGWNVGLDTVAGHNRVEAFVRLGKGQGSRELQLSRDALLEATSLTGLPKGYVERTPANLIESQLNYWFSDGFGNKDFKFMAVRDTAAAVTRASINPFSNLRLLDETLASVDKKYGSGEVLVDPKLSHSLRNTYFRLVVPENTRVIERTGTDNDTWSVGVQVKNSLIGDGQTQIDGYLFRYWCTNGAIDTHASSGKWSRRSGGQGDEVFEWARTAVDEVLGGLEGSLDAVQALVDIPLQGEINDVLRDVFEQYRVPVPTRQRIIDNMVADQDLTAYSLMQAITQVANDVELSPAHVEALMRTGGDLSHVVSDRCEACHRLKL